MSDLEAHENALLGPPADGLVAAPRVVLDLLLAHLNARAAAVRIGKIGDPAPDPDAASHVVDPQPSIEGGGAFEEPETADRRAQGDADRQPEEHGARAELEPVREDLGTADRVGPDPGRLPTLRHRSSSAGVRLWPALAPLGSCCARARRRGIEECFGSLTPPRRDPSRPAGSASPAPVPRSPGAARARSEAGSSPHQERLFCEPGGSLLRPDPETNEALSGS